MAFITCYQWPVINVHTFGEHLKVKQRKRDCQDFWWNSHRHRHPISNSLMITKGRVVTQPAFTYQEDL